MRDDEEDHAAQLATEALELPLSERATFLDVQCQEDSRLRREADRILAQRLHQRQKQLFETASALPASERTSFLKDECGSDEDLLARMRALLNAPDTISEFLPTIGAVSTPDLDVGELTEFVPGEMIGPYRVTRHIGEGGMGSVYEAMQTGALTRRVALKVIKLGMGTREVLSRFAAERETLARLAHQNIARVFDAGTTTQGNPYFVMEFVQGEPLTDYCDRHRLTVHQRIELMIDVCAGVAHAHARNVIHRDLKPANILVTDDPDARTPKIIDFGIAKAVSADANTSHTLAGQLIGTPDYMSPEQAEGRGFDINWRTDVYALGAVLHELLVGARPFEAEALNSFSRDIARTLREVEPPLPSVHARAIELRIGDIAANRCTQPALLIRVLRGELDWIIARAMHKDPAQRYESPTALAADLRRYLGGLPVEAAPPGIGYRVWKFARRRRIPIAALALTALLATLSLLLADRPALALSVALATVASGLIVGLAIATAGLRRAGLERDSAERARAQAEHARRESQAARDDAERQRDLARDAEQRAQRQVAITQAVNSFLSDDLLAAVAPEAAGRDVSLLEVVDAAASRIAGRFEDAPQVRTALQTTLGNTYLSLGQLSQALPLLEDALETRIRDLGDLHPDTLASKHFLSELHIEAGRLDEAESLLRTTLDARTQTLGSDHPDTLLSRSLMGVLCYTRGQYALAEPLYRSVVDACRARWGAHHERTLTACNDLAVLLKATGRLDEAEQLYRQILKTRMESLGEDNPTTLTNMNNLAALYFVQNRFEDAAPLLEKTLNARRRTLGDDHPRTLISLSNLAGTYDRLGRHADALPLHELAVQGARTSLASTHWHTGLYLARLGSCLTSHARFIEAETALLEAHGLIIAKRGESDEWTRYAIEQLGTLYEAWQRPDDAARWRTKLDGSDSRKPDSTPPA